MWSKLLDRVGCIALADEPPILAAIVLSAIETVQQLQPFAPDLRGELALADCVRRVGLGVDALNAMHDGAIDPASINEDLSKKISAIVDSVNAAERSIWAFAGDVRPGNVTPGAKPLEPVPDVPAVPVVPPVA